MYGIYCRGPTESFLLRRMNSGPGVKPAVTIGTTGAAAHMTVWVSFIVRFRCMSF